MVKIAIYGKGGIGKSTTSSNLSAAFSRLGYTVMQIGCDPKSDSCKNLMNGKVIPTVLDQIGEKGDSLQLSDITFKSDSGVICVEAGGPTPGLGCAGRGIITAFEKLEELDAYEVYQPDIVLYDVLGDVVCGGFAMPIRSGYADHVFVVTSGEMMALFAAHNIGQAVRNFDKRGYARLGGIIQNCRNIENEDQLVETAAAEMNTEVLWKVPRSGAVQEAENAGETVVTHNPECPQAQVYLGLARKILEVATL
ncbi:MAG: nitrogenase iron protein NifH [Eubacteriales bacterium]